MELILHIRASASTTYNPDEEDGGYWGFESRMSWALRDVGRVYEYKVPLPPEAGGGPPDIPPEILVAFVSGGALTAAINQLVQIVLTYLTRYQGRELTLEFGDKKITVKGHNKAEETELIKSLFHGVLEHEAMENNIARDVVLPDPNEE
jgi:hypothetical protein